MKKLFKFMTKIITLAILLAIMTPVVYLTWRMVQPLDQPEFNGLTYYQFIQWRKLAFEDMAVKYQTQHPDENVSSTMCEGLEVVDYRGCCSSNRRIYTCVTEGRKT